MNLTSMKSLSQSTSSVDSLKLKVVTIHWVDAQTIGGAEWMEKKEACKLSKLKLPTMATSGFLIHEDETQYVIASTVGPVETSQIHKIPKCMVTDIMVWNG